MAPNIQAIKFIGQYQVPYNYTFNQTTVGGLSSIDYDAKHQLYYFICDDRSNINPARLYTAAIKTTATGIDTVVFKQVVFLKMPNGTTYPSSKSNPSKAPDPESMRYNPITKQLFWTSEGEKIVDQKDTVLENPAITIIATNGKFIDSFPLPKNCIMQVGNQGPRHNGVFEGITFANHYTDVFVNIEEPLFEDGPQADIVPNNAVIRFFQFNVANKKNTAQYAYLLEPVAHPSTPSNKFKINGVSDILWVGQQKMLVIERSFSTGIRNSTIKVFLTDLSNATNVKDIPSLHNNQQYKPASKKLLVNMDDLGIFIDNIEGVTFGPTLPNGHKTLLFIADNNFDEKEISQLLLFEILE